MSLLMDALKKAEKAKKDAQSPQEESAALNEPVLSDGFSDAHSSDDQYSQEAGASHAPHTEVPVDAGAMSLEPRPDLEATVVVPDAPVRPSASVEAAQTADAGVARIHQDAGAVAHDHVRAEDLFRATSRSAGITPALKWSLSLGVLMLLLLVSGGYIYYERVSSELKADIDSAVAPVKRQQKLAGDQAARNQVSSMSQEKSQGKSQDNLRDKENTRGERSLAVKQQMDVPVASAIKKPVKAKKIATTSAAANTSVPDSKPLAPQARAEQNPRQIQISKQLVPDNVYELLSKAYAAFQTGDDAGALALYSRVLEIEFNNRDALLGLAAISVRNSQYEKARDTYVALLENNPRDSVALSGLLNIQSNVDPVSSETQIKLLLNREPGSPHLLFTLGSLYASQQRWAEAQAAFFRAYSSENSNADFAYNLAVSLDQLEQRREALRYYRRSLDLVKQKPITFNVNQVMKRINVLLEVSGG